MLTGQKPTAARKARATEAPGLLRMATCLLGVAVVLGGCRRPATEEAAPSVPKDTEGETPAVVSDANFNALAEFNKGAARLERYEYVKAVEAFERVVEVAPDWLAAQFNLGLSHFNLQEAPGGRDHLEIAREIYQRILEADPDHVHARFCLGLYYQHLGDNEKALECFEAVHERDPEEPYAAYKLAETLISVQRNEEATKVLEKIVERDPGFVSAVYRLAGEYRRARQMEKAMPLFERFKGLNAAETAAGSFTVRYIYGMSGKYYTALGADNLPLPKSEELPGATGVSPVPGEHGQDARATRRIVFSPETKPLEARPIAWQWKGGAVNLPGIAAGDIDGDGDLDLCLTALDERGSTSIWLNDGSGSFSQGPVLAEKGVSPCFGDVDNDGDLDLWLGRAGPDVLLQNDGSGTLHLNLPIGLPSEVQGPLEAGDKADAGKDAAISLGGADLLTSCARLLDLDSDGDLDFVAFRLAAGNVPAVGELAPAESSVFNNNRDGTFTDVAARLGLTLEETPVAAAVYDDFDNDRDVDLVIFPAGDAEPIGWVNYRVWAFEVRDAAATGLAARGVVGATSGDPDKDGDRDLLVFTTEGVELYVNDGSFRFQRDQTFSDHVGSLGGTGGQFADMDNDGDLDLVIADAHRPGAKRGPALLVNDWPRHRFVDVVELDPGNLFAAVETKGDASCVVADFTGNGRCDVLLAPAGEPAFLMENVTPGGHWIALDLLGTRQRDKTSRSNNSAIGARVEIKSGTVFQQFVVGVPSGPVASPPHRIHAGLGENPKLEWLRIVWPDGILQAELELAADQVTTVTEVERKPTSCPHLFAWNGSRFEFVSDFGGMGGLGYFLSPGSYATPDPTEYLPIPRLEPLGDEYVLQVVEPLEEVVYFDEARLIAVDHPVGTEVFPREMMAINSPPPPFEVFCFEDPIDPVRAVDHRGVDVTEELFKIDRRYAGAVALDRRFNGFAEEHTVELDFGDRLERVAPESRLVLVLNGSVEYSYSSTNFAAGQAGMRIEAPTIDVLRDGEWIELYHEVGYPAGLQHTMTLDVTGKILPGDRRIRITSNMELYWDRVFLAVHRGDAPLALQEVSPERADLHFFGYTREYSPDGQRPNLYDYGNVDRTASWKLTQGDYTRYGEVAELLRERDDCYVVMKHGEGLTLRFPAAALGPVPEGCRRSFMLKTDTFCKDMDLYTAHPDTVEPLPFHGMSGYPYSADEHYPDNEKTREYRQRFNTRRVRVE